MKFEIDVEIKVEVDVKIEVGINVEVEVKLDVVGIENWCRFNYRLKCSKSK